MSEPVAGATPLAKALSEVLSKVRSEPPAGPGDLPAGPEDLPAGPPCNLQRLSAGATSQIWSFDLENRPTGYILRIAAPAIRRVAVTTEAQAMSAAAVAGVPVPRILVASDDPRPFGQPFMIMERVEGESLARRILRDEQFSKTRQVFASQCGEILGRLRTADPSSVPGLEDVDQLESWEQVLRGLGVAVPTFEWALRYLRSNRPPGGQRTLVHGDFRLGNMIFGPEGVRAVLDWEGVHVGDPLEDLGWLCARPWRFRGPAPVGGMGSYQDLLGAYERACGVAVSTDELKWWEVFATLRWGIICVVQAARHLQGAERSVELAAIGRRVAETELDLLDCLP